MPRQGVHGPRRRLRRGGKLRSRLETALCRLALAAGTGALTYYGITEMYAVTSAGGVTALQWLFLVIFSVNFAWVSFAGCQAVLGFLRLHCSDYMPRRRRKPASPNLQTAILAPVYAEDPVPVAAALSAMAAGLERQAPGRFAIFVLSDTTRADAWVTEERVFSQLTAEASAACPIYYRHRRQNTERKAGNIADWVTRWGGGYDAMLILDADSLMAPETVIEMAHRLEADPGLGLLQTLPAIKGGRTLYARMQQFANRCYGPIFGNGLAAWHGRSSNFWGHNAIIRVQAFAEAARLPELSGKPPMGGTVLSHDFIEAALLRRAGWGVRLDADLEGSYEEAPPSLLDVMVRDRRWCQGNLQHSRFLFAKGLTFATRLHLLAGMMAYVSAFLWLALIVVGLVVAVQAAITKPEYFAEPSLFPTWPVFDSERAVALFVVAMAVVLAPKVLGWLRLMLNPRRLVMRYGGPLALTLSLFVEALLSALYAPIMMLCQSQIVREVAMGGDSGWHPQRRQDGSIGFSAAFRAHGWHTATGTGLALLAYELNPHLFFWLLPLTAGLVLAAPLSYLSASKRLGGALRCLAILRTPEEQRRTRPDILNVYDARLEHFAGTEDMPIEMLARNRALRDWHLAQLPRWQDTAGSVDEALVLARAKAEHAGDRKALEKYLTPDETMAFLHDRRLIEAWC